MPLKNSSATVTDLHEYQQRANSSGPAEALKSSGGDGTSGGMEARMAKVEAAVEHIGRELTDIKSEMRTLRADARSDFRLLFAAIIGSFFILGGMVVGLGGVMAKGFKWF